MSPGGNNNSFYISKNYNNRLTSVAWRQQNPGQRPILPAKPAAI